MTTPNSSSQFQINEPIGTDPDFHIHTVSANMFTSDPLSAKYFSSTFLPSPAFEDPDFYLSALQSAPFHTHSNEAGCVSSLSAVFSIPRPNQLGADEGLSSVELQTSGGILVVDPPRARLIRPAEPSTDSLSHLTPIYPPLSTPHREPYSQEVYIIQPSLQQKTCSISVSSSQVKVDMAKKRRSLQSIFVPSFLHSSPPAPSASTSSTHGSVSRMRSHSLASQLIYHRSSISIAKSDTPSPVTSPRNSPPPEFLLDDDPFANLSSVPHNTSFQSPTPDLTNSPQRSPESITFTPRSPLSPTDDSTKTRSVSSPVPSVPASPSPGGVFRALSSGPGHVQPAHKKPAFAPRPSLPSLHTLARMNIMIPKKVRKGRVGAHLPYEPWDMDLDSDFTPQEPSGLLGLSSTSRVASSLEPPDFTADLDFDFMDLSDDDEQELLEAASSSTRDHNDTYDSYANSDLSLAANVGVTGYDASPSSLTRTLSMEISSSSLSRSISSSISNSSSGSSGNGEPTITQFKRERLRKSVVSSYGSTSYLQSSSAESVNDILNSPPDDYFSFPPFQYPSSSPPDSKWNTRSGCSSPNVGPTPHSSFYSDVGPLDEPEIIYEPGTSAGTIRGALLHPWPSSHRSNSVQESWINNDEAVDGSGWDEQGQSRRGYSSTWNHNGSGGGSRRTNGSRENGSGGGDLNGGSGRGSGGQGGDDGNNGRRNGAQSSFSTPSSSEASTSDEEEESNDDYGQPTGSLHSVRALGADSGSDDDIPLAQRIPTALTAQKTIRKRVREERHQRRKDRAARAEYTKSPRERQSTLRPADPRDPTLQMSSSQEAALHASKPIKRERTQTLHGSATRPFAIEDLTKKLLNIQGADSSMAQWIQNDHVVQTPRDSFDHDRTSVRVRKDHRLNQQPPPQPQGAERALRPMRSFHRSEVKPSDDYRSVPMPIGAEQRLGRSVTTHKSRQRANSPDLHGGKPRSFTIQGGETPSMDRVTKSRRPSQERGKPAGDSPEPRPNQTLYELDNRPVPRTSLQRHPVPPLPRTEVITHSAPKTQVTQQRVFIRDMQRFNIVEIGPSTTAKDILELVEAQGTLEQWVGPGGWMVWEVAQDFGMERPIRSFELISDVQTSWNKDKMVNTFVIKLTPLAPLLSRSAIPSSSPTCSGYVEWESKRGKWNKRWMQLREHSLWLSKRDTGKDETFLCSLSNFDAYFVTRVNKTPKPFVFAVKSTDNISYFENTADYLHMFSCGQKEGEKWMDAILLARSYVLHQERNVLFNPKATVGTAGSSGPGPHLRSGARTTTSTSHRPVQPLVNVAAPYPVVPPTNVFKPGSLLRKQT